MSIYLGNWQQVLNYYSKAEANPESSEVSIHFTFPCLNIECVYCINSSTWIQYQYYFAEISAMLHKCLLSPYLDCIMFNSHISVTDPCKYFLILCHSGY